VAVTRLLRAARGTRRADQEEGAAVRLAVREATAVRLAVREAAAARQAVLVAAAARRAVLVAAAARRAVLVAAAARRAVPVAAAARQAVLVAAAEGAARREAPTAVLRAAEPRVIHRQNAPREAAGAAELPRAGTPAAAAVRRTAAAPEMEEAAADSGRARAAAAAARARRAEARPRSYRPVPGRGAVEARPAEAAAPSRRSPRAAWILAVSDSMLLSFRGERLWRRPTRCPRLLLTAGTIKAARIRGNGHRPAYLSSARPMTTR
jgi:hypothetical protein